MNIIIQSLGFKASAALEAMITEKLNSLKSDKINSATVTLYKALIQKRLITIAKYGWICPATTRL